MFTYKVKRKCFINGVYRVPGGRHDPYRVAEKLDPCPSALELIDEKDAPKPKRTRTKKDAAPKPTQVQGMKMKTQDVEFKEQADLDVI